MAIQQDDLVAIYDKAPLDTRYWVSITLAVMTSIFDFFDFFIVGFLVAVLAPQWHLTFGQTSVMLLSAGVGAIVGALAWGALAGLVLVAANVPLQAAMVALNNLHDPAGVAHALAYAAAGTVGLGLAVGTATASAASATGRWRRPRLSR